jgi:signal transduction histidine kinase
VGGLDYATGYEFEVTAFYLVPVCWASWRCGRQIGALLSGVCVTLAFAVDLTSNRSYTQSWIAVWNAVMLLAVFIVAVYAITSATRAFESLSKAQEMLRDANERLEETVQKRTAALRAEIVERERIEKAKLEAERLLERQEKLAVLGTLTAGIAHEVRNPLTSMKARLYTLDKHLAELPGARKQTEIIHSEIQRLERIVHDALSFARPENPRLEAVDLQTLLEEVFALMSASLEERGMHLQLERGSGLCINADTGMLKQVIINLVRNAADAIDGAGNVTLRYRAAQPSDGESKSESVAIEIEDTGKGIAPEIEKRLFDPFFTTKATGTGLGLSIAARMVEQHGGEIRYHTKLNQGTIFQILLPVQK